MIEHLQTFVLAEHTGFTQVIIPSTPWWSRLVERADRLPALKAVFLGDVNYWVPNNWHGNVTPLLYAFPDLEYLGVRGGHRDWVSLESIRHDGLQALVIEGAYTPVHVLKYLRSCTFPNLRHLEIWQGNEEQDMKKVLEETKALLHHPPFPKLKYLGLRNHGRADDVCELLMDAPILDGLEVLDLSLGALSDAGGEALLANPRLQSLKRIILHWHWCSDKMAFELCKRLPGVEIFRPKYQDMDFVEVYLEILYCNHDFIFPW